MEPAAHLARVIGRVCRRANEIGGLVLALTSAALAAACVGEIQEPGSGELDPKQTAEAMCKAGTPDPGPALMRRLTNRDYRRALEDLFGIDSNAVASLTQNLPPDGELHGFDNQATTQGVSTLHAERYQTVAESLALQVVQTPALRDAVVGCDPITAGCTQSFIEAFGKKAYRRPLSPTESARMLALAATAGTADPYAGVGLVIEAVLQSPKFLFRPEIGREVAGDPRQLLSGHELAVRLSFLLWGSPPDAWLYQRAEAGELDSAESVRTVAQTMLADARAHAAFESFYSQWFRIDEVATVNPDPQKFPEFDASLQSAMAEEMRLLIGDFVLGGKSFIDLFTADYTYVDDRLAAHYGLVPPAGSGLRKVTLTPDTQRGGVLTSAGFLTLTSKPSRTSPIHRGVYVRDVVLCDPLPPPPPGVIPEEPATNESEADTLQKHSADPMCKECHQKIDPIGFGLDRYDAIGRVRWTNDVGESVILDGSVSGLDEPAFSGGIELGQRVNGTQLTSQCAVRQLFRWALARMEGDDAPGDDCLLEPMFSQFEASSYDFRQLIVELVTSDAFRYRRAE